MIVHAILEFFFFALVVMGLALPCSFYLTRIFNETGVGAALRPLEAAIGRFVGPLFAEQQNWTAYLRSVLVFNALGSLCLFLILLFQSRFPWNPQDFGDISPDLAFNIAVSFMTNTNWQAYSGESTLSFFSQMAGLTVQNFLSAATGIAVAFAVVRGFIRKENPLLGNFYKDLVRVILYIMLPFALILSLFLLWQGVPQTMQPFVQATTLEGGQQMIAQGPVASQVAVKMLGSNGGGFFNVNSAHPYENPTPLSNFIEIIAILLIDLGLVLAFGRMVGDKKQSRPLLICMTFLFVVSLALGVVFEHAPHPGLAELNVDQAFSDINPGGNMEGKETRFGIFDSVLWSIATSATSNGAVNSMLDSYMPLGGLVPLFNLLIGEVIYGGVGCGLYGMLIYVLMTVFIAGLMVGRTPEYLGKKIEAHEIKCAVIALFLYPVCVLGMGAISISTSQGAHSITAYGPHGLTQTIYAYASATANNGSSFAGFNSDTVFQNIMLAVVMLLGRFGVIAPVLAIAGSLAKKKIVPSSGGTFPTHGGVFVVLLTGVVILFGGLTYFPALALGPIAEQLSLAGE